MGFRPPALFLSCSPAFLPTEFSSKLVTELGKFLLSYERHSKTGILAPFQWDVLLYKHALLSNLPLLQLVVLTESRLTCKGTRAGLGYHSPFTKQALGAAYSGVLGGHRGDTRKTPAPWELTVKQRQSVYKAGKQGRARPRRRELLLQWGLCTPSACPWGASQGPGLGKPQEQARHVPALTELTV